MSALRVVVYGLTAIKYVVAAPCVIWGSLIGVIGIGPDGAVPWSVRPIGLCVLAAGATIAYPLSLFPYRGFWNWVIALPSGVPLALMAWEAVKHPDVWREPGGFAVYFALGVVSVLLVLGDLLLSRWIGRRNNQ